MWKLLKSEYEYHRSSLIVITLFFLPMIIVNIFYDGFQGILLRVLVILPPIMGIIAAQEERLSHKTPMRMRLPLSLRSIAVTRYLFWIIPWICLILLAVLSSAIRGSVEGDVLQLLIIAGAMIAFMSAASMLADLQYCFKRSLLSNAIRILIIILMLAAVFLYLGISFSARMRDIASNLSASPNSILIIVATAILFMITGIVSFECRKSYLE
ncbi:MAG: ABC-2 transporter permease [candidate division KSB1 bacterium]|jgi:hypothetical protein|nr:ABC-2 transporter permease [candidate division KSB1 bacterium]